MIYKIIVDKQPMSNPSEEKREYEIDIDTLHYKDEIYDSLVITHDEDYVMRRLELNEYGVLIELDPPVKEPLQDINIELFEGDNYIYLYDMIGNTIIGQYLIKNEFNELYVTESEMNAAIEITAGSIELSVQRQIQRVDSDIEELSGQVVEITTDYVKFTDLREPNENTTINGANITTGTIKSQNYDPDDVTEGMAINLVDGTIDTKNTKWDTEGNILLNNNAKIITDNGLITNLQFQSKKYGGNGEQNIGWNFTGFSYNAMNDEIDRDWLEILADIPSNFIIKEAYINLLHQPVYYSNTYIRKYGYTRQIQAYTGSVFSSITAEVDSEYIEDRGVPSEISNAFGSNGWTPVDPNASSSNVKVTSAKSINIKNSLTTGQLNRIILQSKATAPTLSSNYETNQKNCAEMTGRIIATLDIIGYMKFTE